MQFHIMTKECLYLRLFGTTKAPISVTRSEMANTAANRKMAFILQENQFVKLLFLLEKLISPGEEVLFKLSGDEYEKEFGLV